MSTPQSAIVVAGIGATLELFRLSADLIATASQRSSVADAKLENATPSDLQQATLLTKERRSTMFFNGRFSFRASNPIPVISEQAKNNNINGGGTMKNTNDVFNDITKNVDDEAVQVVSEQGAVDDDDENDEHILPSTTERILDYVSALSNFGFFVYFLTVCIINATGVGLENAVYDAVLMGCAAATMFFALMLNIRDFTKQRFSSLSRTLHVLSALFLLLGIIFLLALGGDQQKPPAVIDIVSLVVLVIFCILAIVESKIIPYPKQIQSKDDRKKARLDRKSILIVLKPYFWPDATATSATLNRIRALTTWLCVGASKTLSLFGPMFLGRASTALTRMEYTECIKYVVLFCLCNFTSSFFKESQSLVYLKVAQAAFVQLSEVAFHHLHSLSLDWHLKKKLGEVIRSMDRGIAACDILMKYLFLWLFPAIAECILVCIIFWTVFDNFALGVTVFYFVFAYMVMTVVTTLWRKKFRKQVAKSDNDWHDRCTDSLVNFETVKFFTAEEYEMKRFGEAVQTYQVGSVNVAASLSVLNISQQLLLQACLATSLSLATISIRDRMDCCLANGCEASNSACCSALSSVCSGMEIGDFVAVLTYTINLFMPLNFLGSVYNAIVMAVVDLTNLSELLAESPDVSDVKDAIAVPPSNDTDPNTVVEFDDVVFHYPSQSDTSGLKGVSFKMKKGTVTAVVGTTGAGKTTVSRLLFRFYDVLGGAVKVNGVDVRVAKQRSLREMIGVVPQATTMFNDTLKENIRYGKRDATQEELDEVAKAAQLTSFIESIPDGWDTMVGDRGLKLSGGEKQRTAIARCLLKNPPIVILDEATSALDTITESSVQEALDGLGEDRTVLVIAHRLGTIRNADNIIVLGDGKVAEEGTHEELLALGGKYADMWNMQLNSTKSSGASLVGLDTE